MGWSHQRKWFLKQISSVNKFEKNVKIKVAFRLYEESMIIFKKIILN